MANKTPNNVHEFRETAIHFLGEKDGVPERELKNELVECFKRTSDVFRAYLAVVRYSARAGYTVAVCLAADAERNSKIVSEIASVFSRMFRSNQHLDIVFIDKVQEARLVTVCRPFYIQRAAE